MDGSGNGRTEQTFARQNVQSQHASTRTIQIEPSKEPPKRRLNRKTAVPSNSSATSARQQPAASSTDAPPVIPSPLRQGMEYTRMNGRSALAEPTLHGAFALSRAIAPTNPGFQDPLGPPLCTCRTWQLVYLESPHAALVSST